MASESSLATKKSPEHIGIIMDGNGRWAQNRGQSRSIGHKEGLKAAKRVVKSASDLGVNYLSLYVFSTENWKRTEDEISFLMGLLKKYLKAEYDFYRENEIRVLHSGDREVLPADIIREIDQVVNDTAHFTGLAVNLCINYGGQNEIVRAVRRVLEKKQEPNEVSISENLDQNLPPVDLIIRTAGEQRLSNFLIWQSAYAEYYFSDKFWPDWDAPDLEEAVRNYGNRKRRYGGYDE